MKLSEIVKHVQKQKKAVDIKKIEKLGNTLVKGLIAHTQFDITHWNHNLEDREPEGNRCGFAGCSIGNLPSLFPKDFKWNGDDVIQKKGRISASDATGNEGIFLGLPSVIFNYLFVNLPEDLTAKQAGRHILKFVKDFKAGKYDSKFLPDPKKEE